MNETDRATIDAWLGRVLVQLSSGPSQNLRPTDPLPNRETSRWDNRNDNVQGETP